MPEISHEPILFTSIAELHGWLSLNHETSTEVWLRFFRKDTGLVSITYPEARDEALCWGWIDGIVKRYDQTSFVQRFTPRKPRSHWSKVNVAIIAELERCGRLMPAGRAAYERRDEKRTGMASYEQETPPTLSAAHLAAFKAHPRALRWFEAQPAGYRKVASNWVESAKQAATRERRFDQLLARSSAGERLPQFVSAPPSRR